MHFAARSGHATRVPLVPASQDTSLGAESPVSPLPPSPVWLRGHLGASTSMGCSVTTGLREPNRAQPIPWGLCGPLTRWVRRCLIQLWGPDMGRKCRQFPPCIKDQEIPF